MSYKRRETYSYDPVTCTKRTWHELDRGQEWAVETTVDVTDIVEANKAQYAATDPSARWGKPGEVFAHVARIPNHIYFNLVREGIIDPNDDESLLRYVQNRDNLAWRTRPGRLI